MPSEKLLSMMLQMPCSAKLTGDIWVWDGIEIRDVSLPRAVWALEVSWLVKACKASTDRESLCVMIWYSWSSRPTSTFSRLLMSMKFGVQSSVSALAISCIFWRVISLASNTLARFSIFLNWKRVWRIKLLTVMRASRKVTLMELPSNEVLTLLKKDEITTTLASFYQSTILMRHSSSEEEMKRLTVSNTSRITLPKNRARGRSKNVQGSP